MNKDIIIIGGGPGGYTAAIRAAQLGADVCLIEKDKLGGTCLNRGCIPTKTLYRSAEVLNNLKEAEHFGIKTEGGFEVDGQLLRSRCDKVTSQLRDGIAHLLQAKKIERLDGLATFKDSHSLSIALSDGTTVERTASKIIIATGSVPAIPPLPGHDLEGVISSDELLAFNHIPESLVIVGGGVIGIEFASIYNAFGTKVTVVEMQPNILGQVDSDITKRFVSMLKRKGITVHAGTKVNSIQKSSEGSGLEVSIEAKGKESSVSGQYVLMAVGRKPMVDGLGLSAAGVEFTNRGITVNSLSETNVAGVYAIGDVNGGIMLAHWAAHQGIHAVEHALGHGTHGTEAPVPGCIFTFPEISMVGMTEDEAKLKLPGAYKTSKFLFGANGKALALGEPEGFVKTVTDFDGVILGVHIMGPHASDLIHEGVVAVSQKMNVADFRNIIHAHPTLGETMHEGFMAILGEAIHQV